MLVRSNDINPHMPGVHTCIDALQPASYATWQRAGLDCVIRSPFFSMMDMALPLAVQHSRQAVCMHVAASYYTDATDQRLAYLGALKAAGRLFVIFHLPRGPIGRRCGWLVIFASSGLAKRALLRIP